MRRFPNVQHAILAACTCVTCTPTAGVAQSTERGEDDIVVTATRREMRLQDTPIAISAYTTEQLARSGVSDLRDIVTFTPGLTIGTGEGQGAVPISIRGVGQNDLGIGADAPIGIYLDGVYLARPYMNLFDLVDAERVEVLRGPQGTLYGRNATGGAINVVTRRPGDEVVYTGSARYGNYSAWGAQALLMSPLTSTLSGKLAISASGHDGYTRLVSTGRPIDPERTLMVRGALRWRPNGVLDVQLNADGGYHDMPVVLHNSADPGFSPDRIDINSIPREDRRSWGLSLDATYALPVAELHAITGYRKATLANVLDTDAGPTVVREGYRAAAIVRERADAVGKIVPCRRCGAYRPADRGEGHEPGGIGRDDARRGAGREIHGSIRRRDRRLFGARAGPGLEGRAVLVVVHVRHTPVPDDGRVRSPDPDRRTRLYSRLRGGAAVAGRELCRTSPGGSMKSKIYDSPADALEGVLFDGMTVMSGGFGLSGNPESLIPEIRAAGVKRLTVISNNAGADGFGLWMLLESRQIAKMISSYVGENKLFEQQYLSGELELELTPQGTLAERIRAGGAGIPAFYTKTGVGTVVAEGKPVETFDGEDYVRETWLKADLSIIKAWRADPAGNLMFRKTARNFNPNMATAGKVTVVEVEEIVEPGAFDPDCIHVPGIYVDRIVLSTINEKRIEKLTERHRETT
jgi:3-oxoacid CoA-transferase A subunit